MPEREPYYLVVRDHPFEPRLEGLPTPGLIEAGRGEAYLRDGIWYLRDDKHGYTAPKYTRVRVIRNPAVR